MEGFDATTLPLVDEVTNTHAPLLVSCVLTLPRALHTPQPARIIANDSAQIITSTLFPMQETIVVLSKGDLLLAEGGEVSGLVQAVKDAFQSRGITPLVLL